MAENGSSAEVAVAAGVIVPAGVAVAEFAGDVGVQVGVDTGAGMKGVLVGNGVGVSRGVGVAKGVHVGVMVANSCGVGDSTKTNGVSVGVSTTGATAVWVLSNAICVTNADTAVAV